MSLSSAQSAAFAPEAIEEGSVWAIRDAGGFPAPANAEGNRAMPFWSKRSRAAKIIDTVVAYRGFEPVEIRLDDFLQKWLPGLAKDDLSVGLNWYGAKATGCHFSPEDVRACFAASPTPH